VGLRRQRLALEWGGGLILALAAAARAQTTGSITGHVTAPDHTPLPGITVEATSSSLQGIRVTTSGSDGVYRLPALPPGSYRLKATLSNFRPIEKSVTLSLDTTATVDFTLQLTTAEQVVVSGETPPVDTTSTTSGTSYTASVIAHLPVNRNYGDIVRSNPAVDTDRGETQGRSLALTISGATSAENQWIIDGVNTTNVQKGIQGKAINNEFVQEVEVKAGGYSAEYGGALGGIVNVITKSGSNQFHGDGFFYYDSTSTSADQIFTAEDSQVAEMRLTDSRRLDYGLDLGGYVVKDRLWFFGAYNRVSLSSQVSPVQPITPDVSVNDRFPIAGADNLFSGKFTWNVADSTALVVSIFADPSTSSGAAGADPRQGNTASRLENTVIYNRDPSTWYSDRRVGGTDYGLRWTQLFGSSGLFALQLSRHEDRNSLTAADLVRTIDRTCTGDPARSCPPSTPNSVTGGYGIIDGPLDHNNSQRSEVRGDFAIYPGNHELKVGGGYAYGKGESTYSATGLQEVTIYNDIGRTYYQHDFVVSGRDDLTPLAGVFLHSRVRSYGAFLQDSWRPTSGLTVNLGLRWDKEHLVDYAGNTVIALDNEWQPRVGVVWDPWKDGRTKAYAFAGRFYFTLPTFGTSFAFAHFTVVYTYNYDPVGTAPVDIPDLPQSNPLAWAVGGSDDVDRNLHGTHQDELTIGAERMLDPTFTMGIKATYRRLSDAVEDRCDFVAGCAVINPGSGEKFAAGQAPVCAGVAEDPSQDPCTLTGPASPAARRTYRGIELLARKTVGDKLWAQASYVYSSLRGNYDGAVNQQFQNTSPGLNQDFDAPALWHNAYGNLYLDRPHRFRLDGYWVTPLQLSVALAAFVESGAPTDRLGYLGPFADAGVYLDPRGSTGRLPTQWEADFSLAYPITAGPATVTLQGSVFNLFNNQIATSRDNRWTTTRPDGYPDTIYDPSQEKNNPEYGKFTSRQTPRFFRAAVRVSF